MSEGSKCRFFLLLTSSPIWPRLFIKVIRFKLGTKATNSGHSQNLTAFTSNSLSKNALSKAPINRLDVSVQYTALTDLAQP